MLPEGGCVLLPELAPNGRRQTSGALSHDYYFVCASSWKNVSASFSGLERERERASLWVSLQGAARVALPTAKSDARLAAFARRGASRGGELVVLHLAHRDVWSREARADEAFGSEERRTTAPLVYVARRGDTLESVALALVGARLAPWSKSAPVGGFGQLAQRKADEIKAEGEPEEIKLDDRAPDAVDACELWLRQLAWRAQPLAQLQVSRLDTE